MIKKPVASTVAPTRDEPGRVTFGYSPSKTSFAWRDKQRKQGKEWHAAVRGATLTIIEGQVGMELTRTVTTFGSSAGALEAYEAAQLDRYNEGYHPAGGIFDEKFFAAPAAKPVGKRAPIGATPAPASIDGYASDGRMIADVKALLADVAPLPRELGMGTPAELARAAAALPPATQRALQGLAAACTKGKLREFGWTFTLGYRLASEFDDRALAEMMPKKSVALAKTAIEIAHDGGLAHYCACSDGVRVYNDEGNFEAVITRSVDAFAWALVHRAAVELGTYDAKAYKASLRTLGIKRLA